MPVIFDDIARLTAPLCTLNKEKIHQGKIYIYNHTDSPLETTFTELAPDLFVDTDLEEIFTPEYFSTPLNNKDVYASLHLYGGYLPTARNAKFILCEKGQKPTDTMWDYKQVIYTDEQTIKDLYKNACAYQYNPDTDTYIRLPENGAIQNSLKIVMQKRITEIAGDPYDRIADLSRIILFLLKKVNLTTEEHTLLDPLLQHAQSAIDLADIFNREHHIQDYVQHVKSDPKGYLNE